MTISTVPTFYWTPSKDETALLAIALPRTQVNLASKAQYLSYLEQRLLRLITSWLETAETNPTETHTALKEALKALDPDKTAPTAPAQIMAPEQRSAWIQAWARVLAHCAAVRAVMQSAGVDFPLEVTPQPQTDDLKGLFEHPEDSYQLMEWVGDLKYTSNQ